ncbi:MAG: LysM peptidoglycan-binding domain-containing protein [Puniceicoccaceae bacterium]
MKEPDPESALAAWSRTLFSFPSLVAIGSLTVSLICLLSLNKAREQIEDSNRRLSQIVRQFEAERRTVEDANRQFESLIGRFEQLERKTSFEIERGNSRIRGMDEELIQVRDTVVELVRRERQRIEAIEAGRPDPSALAQPALSPDERPALRVDSTQTYTVAEGDNLYRISRKLNLTVRELLDVNPDIDPDRLRIGQVLNIPVVPGR